MNRDCHGDFILVNGLRRYCCFANSVIIDGTGLNPGDQCPECAREIKAPTVAKEVKIETVIYVVLPERGRLEIAKELLSPPVIAPASEAPKDYYWKLDGSVAVLVHRMGEPVRYNKESLLSTISSAKKQRACYASDEAHQRSIQMFEEGLLVFPASVA